jgi:hypothetical protein
MVDYTEYPEAAGERKSEWDARQLFVKELQEINESANRVKAAIELREGTKGDIAGNYSVYLSLLRWYYRDLRPFFDEQEKAAMDIRMEELRHEVDSNLAGMKNTNVYPLGLEKKMEEFQNAMHEKRFRMGLVIPLGVGKDETGILGWEG